MICIMITCFPRLDPIRYTCFLQVYPPFQDILPMFYSENVMFHIPVFSTPRLDAQPML